MRVIDIENGSLSAARVQQLCVSSGTSVEELMLSLIPKAKEYARPPISNFYVGTVALGTSGALYFGANFEFEGEALSLTVHAEQAATVNALSNGESGIEAIAISAAPCGFCRQFLNELTTASRLRILLPGRPAASLSQLLPEAFGPVDLGVSAALMAPQSHGLSLSTADSLMTAALAAANASYAPYTSSYAGVALQTSDGSIHTGSLAENAAYNPGISPLEAAVVSLSIRGGKSYADITDAALVEVKNARASQAAVSRAVLGAIAKVPLRVAYGE